MQFFKINWIFYSGEFHAVIACLKRCLHHSHPLNDSITEGVRHSFEALRKESISFCNSIMPRPWRANVESLL